MPFFSEIDVNKFTDLGRDGVRPENPGSINLERFRNAIARTTSPTLEPLGQGTLYLPPGDYRIAADGALISNWRTNLVTLARTDRDAGTPGRIERIRIERNGNQFGASLVIPAGLTLWLAPGAVLVPERDCIIDLSGALIADRSKLFDLSLGGLVVFGNQVPVLRPEWWGTGAGDDAPAIQAAINAAIGNRSIRWTYPVLSNASNSLNGFANAPQIRIRPNLAVELRGDYQIGRPLKLHGDTTRNDTAAVLNPASSESGGVDSPPNDTTAVIGGVWSGRTRQGATLRANNSLGRNALLQLYFCPGLTLRNIAFETAAPLQPCLELWISTIRLPVNPSSAQMTSVRACRFTGRGATLVQVGPRTQITFTGDDRHPPHARPSFAGGDFSLLAFDECEFRPDGGIALDCMATQTFPIRFRRCDFIGDADAMLSLWDATHLVDGCYFENRREPVDQPIQYGSFQRGYELPDGADIFLRMHYPEAPFDSGDVLRPGLTASGVVDRAAIVQHPYLTGLTATGCVSRSARFLSTVSPTPLVRQEHDWPVILLNVRHRPARPSSGPSVLWGMQHSRSNLILEGATGMMSVRRMGLGAPLVVVGGSYGSPLVVMRGSVQSAVVGARVPGGDFPVVLHDQRTRAVFVDGAPVLPLAATYVFGLPMEPRRGG